VYFEPFLVSEAGPFVAAPPPPEPAEAEEAEGAEEAGVLRCPLYRTQARGELVGWVRLPLPSPEGEATWVLRGTCVVCEVL